MTLNSLSAPFVTVSNACLLAWGIKRFALTLFFGVLAASSLPPLNWFWVLPISFSGLVWLLDGALSKQTLTRRGRFWRGFKLGWVFGFAYFLAGLWWIGSAFLVEADRFAWMLPFAVLAMPTGLALFVALGTAVAALLWSEGWGRIFALAVGLALFEWLRGHILTGFPWNAFGYGVSGSLLLSQTASLVGIYGLGFLTVLIASSPALLTDPVRAARKWKPLVGLVLLLVAVTSYGTYRLYVLPDPEPSDVDVRIVQPAIDQREKWLPENRERIFKTLLEMSQKPLGGNARVGQQRIVVWPESAIPFLLTREPGALFRISRVLNDKTTLATGAVRMEAVGDEAQYFNSIYFIGGNGTVLEVYDKVHLVPFGEYLPLKSMLERLGLSTLVDAPEGFQAGYRQRVLKIEGLPSVIPLICYETIFPAYGKSGEEQASWLLNVTNDAWFGNTPGPYQHFSQASMRAIEQGVPVIRAANTGISAVVDAKGRVLTSVALFDVGVLDEKIPGKIEKTPYGRYGDKLFVFLMVIGLSFSVFAKYNRGSRNN